MRWTLTLLLIQAVLSVNCGMTRVIDNRQAHETYEKGLAEIDDQLGQLNRAMEAHRAREQKLKLSQRQPNPSQFSELKSHMKSASISLNKLKIVRDKIEQQVETLRDFSKDHPKVREQERAWEKTDALHQSIANQFSQFNLELAESSSRLNQLERFWSQSGLLLRHSTQSFAEQLEDLRTRWQSAYSELVANYNLGQKRYSKWLNDGPNRTADSAKVLRPLQTMHAGIGQLSGLSRSFDQIQGAFNRAFGKKAEITSLDKDWETWLEFRQRFLELKEQVQNQVSQCSYAYDRVLDGLKE